MNKNQNDGCSFVYFYIRKTMRILNKPQFYAFQISLNPRGFMNKIVVTNKTQGAF